MKTSKKENFIGNARPTGNFKAQMPIKMTVHDSNDVLRTTIKETNINNNRVGGIKGPNSGKVYNPKQKLATTIKETTMLQNNMGNIDRQKNGGGYKIKNMEAKNTNRQTTSVEYMGDPKGENKGGYQVANVEAKTTSRQFMTDHEYSGAAGPAEVHAPMSYSDIYNATIKSIRQDVAKGRPPIQEGPKVGISKETINMKTNFSPNLINDPLGDPGLIVDLLNESRALLFDLGDLSAVSNSELLKISHVFVSHTHIDHFIGFDRLLRVVFGQGKTIHLFGPKNFISNVAGKLAGFTWNLVDRYNESVTLEVTEVHENRLLKARFSAIDRFERKDEREEYFTDGIIVNEASFTVRTSILEHRVPCLGFALKEKYHINIRKKQLEKMNFQSGSWLNDLKQCIYDGKPDDHIFKISSRENNDLKIPLGRLREDLVLISPGQKIAYIVDTVYKASNKARIVDLVKEADLFFCESPFLAEEEDRGLERYHLTSRQAGLIAGEANVKKLNVFHFSGRHTFRTDQLVREAKEAFLERANKKII